MGGEQAEVREKKSGVSTRSETQAAVPDKRQAKMYKVGEEPREDRLSTIGSAKVELYARRFEGSLPVPRPFALVLGFNTCVRWAN